MNILNLISQFQANPMQMLQRKFNIPGDITQPDQILQHLVNSGQVTQQQINQIRNMGPMFKQFMK